MDLPPNPLNSSLFTGQTGMPGLAGLNPAAAQAAQNQTLTAQQQQSAQDMANVLKKEGQSQNKQFTSPWQVAGQWAQALSGRMKQAQANQGAAALNTATAPGQSGPATPNAAAMPTPSPLPWSGAPAAGASPAASATPTPMPMAAPGMPIMDAGSGLDLSDMFG